MPANAPEEFPIPLWFIVWGGFVAGALLVPDDSLRRFIVDPMLADFPVREGSTPEDAERMRAMMAGFLRVSSMGAAALYLLVRALTTPWRRGGEADGDPDAR
jgi:hypothetical protein